MITGAANADAAVIVVDATAVEGNAPSRYLLHLLGISRVIGVVNKMDLVNYAAGTFDGVRRDLLDHLGALGFDTADLVVVPASARGGDNIAAASVKMAWHRGPTLLGALDACPLPVAPADLPLRLPIQDVYKFDERRIVAGRIESGRLRVGDILLFSPSEKTARVASIEFWDPGRPPIAAGAGQSIGLTLDEPIFIERGQLASHLQPSPMLTNVFRGRLFWLGRKPLRAGSRYLLKLLTDPVRGPYRQGRRVIDTGDLSAQSADAVERNEIGEVIIRSAPAGARSPMRQIRGSGASSWSRIFQIVGGGIIDMHGFDDLRERPTVKSANITRVEPRIALADRWRANGHRSGILWFTGLSGAGKTTLAQELARQLFHKGYQVAVLDGDNLRHGLNADLGFSASDRAENIRRAGEVAALFARAGQVVITAFISPYRADRDRIREAHPDLFHEVYLAATVEECERRDPKGLYAKARAGDILDFTGVSAPYEPPRAPDLRLETGRDQVESCLVDLMKFVDSKFCLQSGDVG